MYKFSKFILLFCVILIGNVHAFNLLEKSFNAHTNNISQQYPDTWIGPGGKAQNGASIQESLVFFNAELCEAYRRRCFQESFANQRLQHLLLARRCGAATFTPDNRNLIVYQMILPYLIQLEPGADINAFFDQIKTSQHPSFDRDIFRAIFEQNQEQYNAAHDDIKTFVTGFELHEFFAQIGHPNITRDTITQQLEQNNIEGLRAFLAAAILKVKNTQNGQPDITRTRFTPLRDEDLADHIAQFCRLFQPPHDPDSPPSIDIITNSDLFRRDPNQFEDLLHGFSLDILDLIRLKNISQADSEPLVSIAAHAWYEWAKIKKNQNLSQEEIIGQIIRPFLRQNLDIAPVNRLKVLLAELFYDPENPSTEIEQALHIAADPHNDRPVLFSRSVAREAKALLRDNLTLTHTKLQIIDLKNHILTQIRTQNPNPVQLLLSKCDPDNQTLQQALAYSVDYPAHNDFVPSAQPSMPLNAGTLTYRQSRFTYQALGQGPQQLNSPAIRVTSEHTMTVTFEGGFGTTFSGTIILTNNASIFINRDTQEQIPFGKITQIVFTGNDVQLEQGRLDRYEAYTEQFSDYIILNTDPDTMNEHLLSFNQTTYDEVHHRQYNNYGSDRDQILVDKVNCREIITDAINVANNQIRHDVLNRVQAAPTILDPDYLLRLATEFGIPLEQIKTQLTDLLLVDDGERQRLNELEIIDGQAYLPALPIAQEHIPFVELLFDIFDMDTHQVKPYWQPFQALFTSQAFVQEDQIIYISRDRYNEIEAQIQTNHAAKQKLTEFLLKLYRLNLYATPAQP